MTIEPRESGVGSRGSESESSTATTPDPREFYYRSAK